MGILNRTGSVEMSKDPREPVPSFAECRAAAHAARSAQHGREAVDSVRPRGVLGVFRTRAPLAVVLYVAAHEGRLVWLGVDGFALLEPPLSQPAPTSGMPADHRLLRLADRRWDMLLYAVPPVVALAVSVGLIAVRPLWWLALVLALAAMLWVVLLMAAGAAWAVVWFVRAFGRSRRRADQLAAEVLPSTSWTVRLCHLEDPAWTGDLLRRTSARLVRLVEASIGTVAGGLGGRVRQVDIVETLTCLRRGITTDDVRDVVEAYANQARPYGDGAEVIVLMPSERTQSTRRGIASGRFLLWYLGGSAIVVLIEAYLVAGWERAACGTTCDGRPATYPTALRWLAQRLLLNDPPGLSPATGRAQVIGWLTSLVALMAVPVAVVAVRQYKRAYDAARATHDGMLQRLRSRTRVLMLVATAGERDAVFTAVRAVNGAKPTRQFRGRHTTFALGQVSEAEILVAQSEQGTVAPGAATLTSAALIDQLAPDHVILAGIGFGLRDQPVGEIMVTSQLRMMDHRKVVDPPDGVGPPIELIRGDLVTPSVLLLDRLRSAQLDWPGQPVHFGLVLSLNTLVNAATERDRLRHLEPDAIGGEMEGAGLYAAAARHKVDWIVVKAIADWGVGKTDDAQELAARSAAEFVVHMIRTGALDPA